MTDEELNETLRALRRARRAADEAREQAGALEDVVKAELEARGVDQITTGDYRVTWKAVTSRRLDAKALKAERPEIYERYAVQTESRRFVIT